MRHSFKVMHDELYTVKVRISPGLDEIKRWILSFGPECQVQDPEILRKLVQQDLQKNLAQYSAPPVSKEIVREMRAVDLGHETRYSGF